MGDYRHIFVGGTCRAGGFSSSTHTLKILNIGSLGKLHTGPCRFSCLAEGMVQPAQSPIGAVVSR